ncbi:hypothetical protein HPB51_014005 [Rhipicephalus microplus]|uniref:Methyltransferase-like protein 4 n=1 Tax=Rhipicephalus microplus TaxID=6941 RepID=A0A9J6DA53_RHIMP|nr:hypothetical protein HPB51_014005 [Rhipicephalus microplus]
MRMDSAAEKLVAGTRRRDSTCYNQPCSWIAEASERIVRAALDAGHLEPGLASDEEVLENNCTARAAAADALAAASGLDACPSLPVGCSFDFILLDPPWANKSARRKRAYSMLPRRQLLSSVPLKRLASPQGCLVAVWCTTNGAHLRFVARELLPSWGLTYLATWYWVKVTKHGEPVRPFDCPHKKPYEFVIFGGPSSLSIPRDKYLFSLTSHSAQHTFRTHVEAWKRLLICVEQIAKYRNRARATLREKRWSLHGGVRQVPRAWMDERRQRGTQVAARKPV